MKGPEVTLDKEVHALEGTVDTIVLPNERGMAGLAGSLPSELLRDASPGFENVPEEQVIGRMRHHWSMGKRTAGIVSGARLEEERLRGNTAGLTRIMGIPFYDRASIFGRPELCVLSRWGLNWSYLPQRLKVTYVRKYEMLAREYIYGLIKGGFEIEAVPIDGCLGDHSDLSGYDLAIGTLCRGSILERTGMWPLDRIWDEEPVLIRMG